MIKRIGLFALLLLLPCFYQAHAADDNVTTVKANQVLQAGSIIPVTLYTPLISDNMSSVVVAYVNKNVYDSVTGTTLLIPVGAKLIGMPSGISGARINVAFKRIIFPDGNSVLLPDYHAIDGAGYSGLKDKYTTHSLKRNMSILTGALLAAGIGAATHNSTGTNSDSRSAGEEAASNATAVVLQGISNQINQNQLSATTTIREGYQFNVILHVDIRIRPYGGINFE